MLRREDNCEFKTGVGLELTKELATKHDHPYRLSRVGTVGIYMRGLEQHDRMGMKGRKTVCREARGQGRRRGDGTE